MIITARHTLALFAVLAKIANAGGIDYVNPAFALSPNTTADLTAARNAILRAADEAARKGPLSARSKNIVAASGDPGDYLSWAEDYWPECNWCPADGHSNGPSEGNAAAFTAETMTNSPEPSLTWSGSSNSTVSATSTTEQRRKRSCRKRLDDASGADDDTDAVAGWSTAGGPLHYQYGNNKAKKMSTMFSISTTTTAPISAPPASTTTGNVQSSASCQPSPTTSTAPNATWTTCPYHRREGQVNPDTQDLPGPLAFKTGSEGCILNALAFALTGTMDYGDVAISFVRALLIDPATAINPSARYAGVIRGPDGTQPGEYMGLIDWRGLIQIANAVEILRKAGAVSSEVDAGLKSWVAKYLSWLEDSEQGQNAAAHRTSHGTFHFGQVAALHLLNGNPSAATAVLRTYFNGPFLDQIDGAGGQPHEQKTADPFKQSCFNLEGMIEANAKLGGTLGVDFWSARTTSGTTIQTAVDYLMSLASSSSAQAKDLLAHVAAAGAVYGDKEGKYEQYLKNSGQDYTAEIWWFFDQPEAVHSRFPSAATKRELGISEDTKQKLEVHIGGPGRFGKLGGDKLSSSSVAGSTSPATSTWTWSSTSSTSTAPSATTSATQAWSASAKATSPVSSSAAVFEPTPGPIPPTPPNDCSSSACKEMSTWTQSTSSMSTASSADHPSGPHPLLQVEVKHDENVKVTGKKGKRRLSWW